MRSECYRDKTVGGIDGTVRAASLPNNSPVIWKAISGRADSLYMESRGSIDLQEELREDSHLVEEIRIPPGMLI